MDLSLISTWEDGKHLLFILSALKEILYLIYQESKFILCFTLLSSSSILKPYPHSMHFQPGLFTYLHPHVLLWILDPPIQWFENEELIITELSTWLLRMKMECRLWKVTTKGIKHFWIANKSRKNRTIFTIPDFRAKYRLITYLFVGKQFCWACMRGLVLGNVVRRAFVQSGIKDSLINIVHLTLKIQPSYSRETHFNLQKTHKIVFIHLL